MAAIPPQLLQMIAAKGGGAAGPGAMPPPAGVPPAGVAPPVSSPMSTPQPNQGEKRAAMVKVQQAMDLLEQALPEFGSESEEGAAVLQVLSGLSKKFGGSARGEAKELMPTEIMNLIASLPRGPAGMKPPMPGMGAPGGAPPMTPPVA